MIPQPEENNALLKQVIAWAAKGAVDHSVECTDVVWPELFELAAQQHVLPLVGCALIRSKDETCPQQLRDMLTGIARRTSVENMIRQQRMLHLLGEMEKAGLDVLVIKGYAVAAHYAYPECRESSDVDLLIDAKQERKATAFLKERGFVVEARAATSQHVVCAHAQYGKIELHVSLYAELVRDVWFQGKDAKQLVCEAPTVCDLPDGSFRTLGCTDHLIFLTLHMMKHFIDGGLTIKMMLDIALFFSQNVQRIDVKRFWNVMAELRYTAVINSILWIMIRYAGFCAEGFPRLASEMPDQMEAILSDLAQGGYMGTREKETRHEASMEYSRHLMRKKQSALQYKVYMLRWKVRTAGKYMFMSYERLSALYPWLKQAAVLYPIVWLYQVFAYPISKIRSGIVKTEIRSDSTQMDSRARARVELFEKMGMG